MANANDASAGSKIFVGGLDRSVDEGELRFISFSFPRVKVHEAIAEKEKTVSSARRRSQLFPAVRTRRRGKSMTTAQMSARPVCTVSSTLAYFDLDHPAFASDFTDQGFILFY